MCTPCLLAFFFFLILFSDDGSAIQDVLLQMTGDRTVPRVFIKQKCVGGGSDTRKLMDEGKLAPLLVDAGVLMVAT